MSDTNIKEIVEEIIDGFVDEFKPFTSLDISNAVKSAGHPFRHREVAAIVRDLWFYSNYLSNHEYDKTNIVVRLSNGRSATAYLYHHETVDPGEYVSRSQTAAVVPRTDQDTPETTQDTPETTQDTPERASILDVAAGTTTRRRRSISDLPARVRKSVFDIADRIKTDVETLVSRRGPRVQPQTEEFDLENVEQQAASVETHARLRATQDATTRRQKADCRLEIPPTWVSTLGWSAGTSIAAISDDSRVLLKPSINVDETEDVNPMATPSTRLAVLRATCGLMKVTHDGRLRLTKTALDNSGINHGPNQELSLVLLDNCISIG